MEWAFLLPLIVFLLYCDYSLCILKAFPKTTKKYSNCFFLFRRKTVTVLSCSRCLHLELNLLWQKKKKKKAIACCTHHDCWGFITNLEWLQSKNVFCMPVKDLQSYAVYSDCFIEHSLLCEAHKHIQKRTRKRRCRATNTLVKIHISKHQNGYCWPVETILAICYLKNKV